MSALFLKYRPQTFSDLVGQESIVRTLQNALKNERPSHAYLFFGSRGTGKTSTARIFAKGLLCPHLAEGNPCGSCDLCRDTANGSLVDVIEIDAASNRRIDEIRELREKIQFAPNRAQRKVYIIDEVHMLTREAFNALLKTLEEPPNHAFFLLATTEIQKLPETIISRCQTFVFHRFTLPQLTERLKSIAGMEGFSVDEASLELIARKAEGGLRDAISLLEQIAAETESKITADSVRSSLGISSSETLEQFWEALQKKDIDTSLALLKDITSSGKDFRTFGHDLLGFLREKLYIHLENTEVTAHIVSVIKEIEEALSKLQTSPIVELPFEIAVIRLCHADKRPIASSVPKQTTSVVPKKQENSLPKKEDSAPPQKSDAGFVFDTHKNTPPQKDRIHQNISSTPSSSPSLKKSDDSQPVQISTDTILTKMKEIAEKAGIPSFAKKSFLTTKPEFAEEKLIFRAASSFHKEKLESESVRIALQNAVIETFQQKILVEFANGGVVSEETRPEVATAEDFLRF